MTEKGAVPRRVLALGATSAIAEAVLRLLAERGASFFLVGRNPDKLAAVRADLLTRGAAAARSYAVDLDDTAAHPVLLAAAAAALGEIDLALIAHGILGNQQEAEADYGAAEAILRTNFLSAVSLAGCLANYFEAQRGGAGQPGAPRRGSLRRGPNSVGDGTPVMAVISSVAGDRGRRSNYIYAASKGGLNVFLEGLRQRLEPAGVRVLTIKPGPIATPMTAHVPPGPFFATPQQAARHILRAIEKRRNEAYVPPYWGAMMLVARNIPGWIFRKIRV